MGWVALFFIDWFHILERLFYMQRMHILFSFGIQLRNIILSIENLISGTRMLKWAHTHTHKVPIRQINAIYTWVFINFYLLTKQFARLSFILPNGVVVNLPWQANVHEKHIISIDMHSCLSSTPWCVENWYISPIESCLEEDDGREKKKSDWRTDRGEKDTEYCAINIKHL